MLPAVQPCLPASCAIHPCMPHYSLTHHCSTLCPPPQVRQELSPWEAKMQEAQNAIDLATTERDMLTRRQRDAEAALQQALAQLDTAKAGAKAKEKRITELKEAMAGSRWVGPSCASQHLAYAPCCC
jgi:hypothetical protein